MVAAAASRLRYSYASSLRADARSYLLPPLRGSKQESKKLPASKEAGSLDG
jgi:hypothetical protein